MQKFFIEIVFSTVIAAVSVLCLYGYIMGDVKTSNDELYCSINKCK